MTTVGELKEVLQNILAQLEGHADEAPIYTAPNTMGIRNEMELYDGFIDYLDIEIDDGD